MTKELNNAARKALKQTITNANLQSTEYVSEAHRQWITSFINAVKETDKNLRFTTQDIVKWSSAFAVETQLTPPSIFLNTYAFGRFLKKHYKDLGFVLVGNYGNRPIYMLEDSQEVKGYDND